MKNKEKNYTQNEQKAIQKNTKNLLFLECQKNVCIESALHIHTTIISKFKRIYVTIFVVAVSYEFFFCQNFLLSLSESEKLSIVYISIHLHQYDRTKQLKKNGKTIKKRNKIWLKVYFNGNLINSNSIYSVVVRKCCQNTVVHFI